MLSGLLITLNILVCIALIGVVLLQRSEGGGFTSGGPTGLITARGAGDLLTRTTWVLFGLFMALSLGLTLLGAHDRTTSSLAEKLKQQHANIGALGPTNSTAPASTLPQAPPPAGSSSPFLAPPITAPPATSPAPSPGQSAAHPARRAVAAARGASADEGQAAPSSPVLVAPPPRPAPRTDSTSPPKTDPNAPTSPGAP